MEVRFTVPGEPTGKGRPQTKVMYSAKGFTDKNGDEVKQYQFNFGSREYYSMDRIQNIQNSAFYEKFANWIEDQNRKEIYPDLPENCYAEKIEVLSNGYMFDGSMRNARYQIQLRLIYQKEVAQECQNEQQ